MNPDKDYYAVLGVPRNVKALELKSAFRRLAITCHPDHHPGDLRAEERFKELSEAYGILSSPEKRARYDRRCWERQQQTARPSPFWGSAETTAWPRASGWQPPPFQAPPRPSPGRGGATSAAADYAERVMTGVNSFRFRPLTKIRKNGWKTWLDKVRSKLSDWAEGWGLWNEPDQPPWHLRYNLALSPEAARNGVEVRFRHEVDGQPRELLIKVPPGIKHGSRLRLAGQGGTGPGRRQGDLILEVLIKPR